MKKLLFLLLAPVANITAYAQSIPAGEPVLGGAMPACAFNRALGRAGIDYHQLQNSYKAANALARTTGAVYDIPVVVHIVYNQPSHNIADSIIANQVTILSEAFRNTHKDAGSARSFFQGLAGDAEIQFHLATTDPWGQPSNGITRTQSPLKHFGDNNGTIDSFERIKKTAQGGIDPWPTDRYLNIWIGNLVNASGMFDVLGYALPPRNPLPPNWPGSDTLDMAGIIDGVVLQVHAVGSNNPLTASLQGLVNEGRTAVHEVGHYLSLQHTFGTNDGTTTGPCDGTMDDGMGDTPEQSLMSFDASSTFSCPSATKNSCGGGAGDLPDMWENYMDYARDACQVMFTRDQVALMRSVLANQRNLLVRFPSATDVIETAASLSVYPNPASDWLMVKSPGNVDKAEIINAVGQKVIQLTGTDAGNGRYDVRHLQAGTYLLVLYQDSNIKTVKVQIAR